MTQDKEVMEVLKIKGMVDYKGHYVVMKQIDKNKKVWWVWSDGAITNEGFKRDRLFNTLYWAINFYRENKLLLKVLSIIFVIMFLIYVVVKYI